MKTRWNLLERFSGEASKFWGEASKFCGEVHLPFSLVADTDGERGHASVVSTTLDYYSRVSFRFGSGCRIEQVYKDVDPALHAGEVLKDVERLRG